MSIIKTHCGAAKRFEDKMSIGGYIRDAHVIAAFSDMATRGAAEFVLRDDGALLMIIRSKATAEAIFKVTRTGLYCLGRLDA